MDKETARKVLDAALETGADFAELYIQNKTVRTVELNYKRVDNVASRFIGGAGLRLMCGVKQIYGYTTDISLGALTALACKLASVFNGPRVLSVGEFESVERDGVDGGADFSVSDVIEYLRCGEQAMYSVSPRIVNARCSVVFGDESVEIFTATAEGSRVVRDRRLRTRANAWAIASHGGAFESGHFGPGHTRGVDVLGEIDFASGARRAAERADALLDAPECPSGKMPVIIGNGFGGVLFHEACGHPLEGTAISHGTSPFAGKIGQKVASELVTAVDDGTVPGGWGSFAYDDEGVAATRNVLIENGVLKNYMVDAFDGRRLGMPPTGACRRQSYKYLPTTRMTNTYIAAGKSAPEDIIQSTERGIYCVSFSGGSVDPTTDEFNFTSSETYTVKGGKIDRLVKSATLTGLGYDILPKIDMVGNDCKLSAGMCGAASGSIPVSVGQPTLRVSEMTVGGMRASD